MHVPTNITIATLHTKVGRRLEIRKRQYLDINIVCASYRTFHNINRLILISYCLC